MICATLREFFASCHVSHNIARYSSSLKGCFHTQLYVQHTKVGGEFQCKSTWTSVISLNNNPYMRFGFKDFFTTHIHFLE